MKFLLVAAVLALGGSAAAAPSATECRELAFASARQGNLDIYVMRSDGTHVRRLTRSPAHDFSPAWSPDGTRLAFRSDRDGNDEVYVMNADGSHQVNLTHDPAIDYSPAWSPDGTTIAFAHGREGDPNADDIWVMNADGTAPRQLESRVGIDEYPVWSPDGRTILFACTGGAVSTQRVGDFEVCAMDSDGGRQRRLTDAPGTSQAYSWSPDGARIAFESSRRIGHASPSNLANDLYTMKADGSDVRRVILRGTQPAWSCDGKRFAFSRADRRGVNVYVMNTAGKRVRPLTRTRENSDAVWRP